MENGSELSLTPNPPPPPPPAAASGEVRPKRDFLLHLESYLSRRDGVDKLLKISRYAAKIALAAPHPPPSSLSPRLRAFESSVGLSRKAFRLGKFVQDVNALRAAARSSSSSPDLLLSAVAYGGEGIYYFIEQLVWLSKAGLISPAHARSLSKISAWAELVGYAGSVALKARELRKIRSALELLIGAAKSAGDEKEGEIRRLREKLLLKQLSLVQDIADGMMAMADVRDGKGFFTDPLLLASAGLVSALISTHKNWTSC